MLSIFLYFLHLGFVWFRSWIKEGSFQQSQVIRFAILKKKKKKKKSLWPPHNRQAYHNISEVKWSKSCWVMSDSLWPHGLDSPWNSPGQNTGVGSLSILQGDLPNPGIEPGSPTLQVDSLPAEPQGKPKNTGVGSLSLLQGIFPTQELNWSLLHCRWILYQLSHQGSL